VYEIDDYYNQSKLLFQEEMKELGELELSALHVIEEKKSKTFTIAIACGADIYIFKRELTPPETFSPL